MKSDKNPNTRERISNGRRSSILKRQDSCVTSEGTDGNSDCPRTPRRVSFATTAMVRYLPINVTDDSCISSRSSSDTSASSSSSSQIADQDSVFAPDILPQTHVKFAGEAALSVNLIERFASASCEDQPHVVSCAGEATLGMNLIERFTSASCEDQPHVFVKAAGTFLQDVSSNPHQENRSRTGASLSEQNRTILFMSPNRPECNMDMTANTTQLLDNVPSNDEVKAKGGYVFGKQQEAQNHTILFLDVDDQGCCMDLTSNISQLLESSFQKNYENSVEISSFKKGQPQSRSVFNRVPSFTDEKSCDFGDSQTFIRGRTQPDLPEHTVHFSGNNGEMELTGHLSNTFMLNTQHRTGIFESIIGKPTPKTLDDLFQRVKKQKVAVDSDFSQEDFSTHEPDDMEITGDQSQAIQRAALSDITNYKALTPIEEMSLISTNVSMSDQGGCLSLKESYNKNLKSQATTSSLNAVHSTLQQIFDVRHSSGAPDFVLEKTFVSPRNKENYPILVADYKTLVKGQTVPQNSDKCARYNHFENVPTHSGENILEFDSPLSPCPEEIQTKTIQIHQENNDYNAHVKGRTVSVCPDKCPRHQNAPSNFEGNSSTFLPDMEITEIQTKTIQIHQESSDYKAHAKGKTVLPSPDKCATNFKGNSSAFLPDMDITEIQTKTIQIHQENNDYKARVKEQPMPSNLDKCARYNHFENVPTQSGKNSSTIFSDMEITEIQTKTIQLQQNINDINTPVPAQLKINQTKVDKSSQKEKDYTVHFSHKNGEDMELTNMYDKNPVQGHGLDSSQLISPESTSSIAKSSSSSSCEDVLAKSLEAVGYREMLDLSEEILDCNPVRKSLEFEEDSFLLSELDLMMNQTPFSIQHLYESLGVAKLKPTTIKNMILQVRDKNTKTDTVKEKLLVKVVDVPRLSCLKQHVNSLEATVKRSKQECRERVQQFSSKCPEHIQLLLQATDDRSHVTELKMKAQEMFSACRITAKALWKRHKADHLIQLSDSGEKASNALNHEIEKVISDTESVLHLISSIDKCLLGVDVMLREKQDMEKLEKDLKETEREVAKMKLQCKEMDERVSLLEELNTEAAELLTTMQSSQEDVKEKLFCMTSLTEWTIVKKTKNSIHFGFLYGTIVLQVHLEGSGSCDQKIFRITLHSRLGGNSRPWAKLAHNMAISGIDCNSLQDLYKNHDQMYQLLADVSAVVCDCRQLSIELKHAYLKYNLAIDGNRLRFTVSNRKKRQKVRLDTNIAEGRLLCVPLEWNVATIIGSALASDVKSAIQSICGRHMYITRVLLQVEQLLAQCKE